MHPRHYPDPKVLQASFGVYGLIRKTKWESYFRQFVKGVSTGVSTIINSITSVFAPTKKSEFLIQFIEVEKLAICKKIISTAQCLGQDIEKWVSLLRECRKIAREEAKRGTLLAEVLNIVAAYILDALTADPQNLEEFNKIILAKIIDYAWSDSKTRGYHEEYKIQLEVITKLNVAEKKEKIIHFVLNKIQQQIQEEKIKGYIPNKNIERCEFLLFLADVGNIEATIMASAIDLFPHFVYPNQKKAPKDAYNPAFTLGPNVNIFIPYCYHTDFRENFFHNYKDAFDNFLKAHQENNLANSFVEFVLKVNKIDFDKKDLTKNQLEESTSQSHNEENNVTVTPSAEDFFAVNEEKKDDFINLVFSQSEGKSPTEEKHKQSFSPTVSKTENTTYKNVLVELKNQMTNKNEPNVDANIVVSTSDSPKTALIKRARDLERRAKPGRKIKTIAYHKKRIDSNPNHIATLLNTLPEKEKEVFATDILNILPEEERNIVKRICISNEK